MAENGEAFCQALADYVRARLGISTEYVTGIPWQEREKLFDAGEVQVLWICGLPYVNKADLALGYVELLAVPIPVGERYLDRPVYFFRRRRAERQSVPNFHRPSRRHLGV
jgi:phosphonate transport system substrate-binding protein